MIRKTSVKASPEPALTPVSELHSANSGAEQPASNASHPLEKQRVRIKAHSDQATIQEVGADALPVSDYPLKQGPLAANAVDLRQQARPRVKRG